MIEAPIIGSVVKVIDKFTDLLKYRQQKRREFFQNVLEPLFNDLMVMHTDYIKMFEDCQEQLLDSNVPLHEIATSLRERRIVYETLRIKSRAIIDALRESNFDEEVKKFLTAAAYHIPDGKLGPGHLSPAATVLKNIYSTTEFLAEASQQSGNPPVNDRYEVFELVTLTVNHVRTRWASICEEYVRAKMWSLK
jgi:hypothetical protein